MSRRSHHGVVAMHWCSASDNVSRLQRRSVVDHTESASPPFRQVPRASGSHSHGKSDHLEQTGTKWPILSQVARLSLSPMLPFAQARLLSAGTNSSAPASTSWSKAAADECWPPLSMGGRRSAGRVGAPWFGGRVAGMPVHRLSACAVTACI